MTEHFWEGGAEEYTRVLMEEYGQEREQLQSQLQCCDDAAQKAAIEYKMEQAKAEYDRKIGEIDQSLF